MKKNYKRYLVITSVLCLLNCTTAFAEEKDLIKQFEKSVIIRDLKSEIKELNKPEIKQKKYSEEDLDLLARLINCESGSDWQSDDFKLSIGNIILNRVKDNRFPDSIYEVIYQKGQYYCAMSGTINNPPSEKSIEIAKRLLNGETNLPENVVWQSEFKQGNRIYKTYYDEILGTTTYFCY